MGNDQSLVESRLLGVIQALDMIRQQVRSPREELFLRVGLSLGHFEEAVATGDNARAEAHARKIADAYGQLAGKKG